MIQPAQLRVYGTQAPPPAQGRVRLSSPAHPQPGSRPPAVLIPFTLTLGPSHLHFRLRPAPEY